MNLMKEREIEGLHKGKKGSIKLFMAHLTVLFSCAVATEEELNLVKQMLVQKQREIDNLTSLLTMKEGKESNVRCDIMILSYFNILCKQ